MIEQLEKWRQAKAEEYRREQLDYHDSEGVDVAEVFLAGLKAAQEVERLIGSIFTLRVLFKETGMDSPLWKDIKKAIQDGEADLAVLLANGRVD